MKNSGDEILGDQNFRQSKKNIKKRWLKILWSDKYLRPRMNIKRSDLIPITRIKILKSEKIPEPHIKNTWSEESQTLKNPKIRKKPDSVIKIQIF